MIQWKNLDSEDQFESIVEDSHTAPQIIFKHSTTCPISSMAKRRLEGNWSLNVNPYYLDLLSNRSISNAIARQLEVQHESPQVILLHKGKAIYNESHLDISVSELSERLHQLANG